MLSRRNTIPASLVAAALASGALAQAEKKKDEDLLRGPRVEDSTPPAGVSSFGEPSAMDRRDAGDPALLLSAVGALDTEEAPLAIRLTDEQRAALTEIRGDHQRVMREWSRGNIDRLAALREKRRAVENAPPEERAEAMRALMRESQDAQASRPDAAPFARRAWDLLTDPQREFVAEKMREAEERRFEERLRRRLGLAPDEPLNPAEDGARGEMRARRDAATVAALGLSREQLREVRAKLLAPPTEEERGMSPMERLDARLDALPEGFLTEEQRERLEAMLIERARSRMRE